MNQQQFDKIVAETKEIIDQLLTVKGGEYAGSEDRLANFKRVAADTGQTPLQVLYTYFSKHKDSFATYVRKDAKGIEQVLSEPIEGRLDDLINYCILAKALIREQEMQKIPEIQEPKLEFPKYSGDKVDWISEKAQSGVERGVTINAYNKRLVLSESEYRTWNYDANPSGYDYLKSLGAPV